MRKEEEREWEAQVIRSRQLPSASHFLLLLSLLPYSVFQSSTGTLWSQKSTANLIRKQRQAQSSPTLYTLYLPLPHLT